MPGEASLAIEVRNLWKVFGSGSPETAISRAEGGATRSEILQQLDQTVAVRDVSFWVARGETFVVMGLSGSGKSTLIRCLSRLIEPTRGEVLLDGEDLLALDAKALREVRRGRISMVFQHFGLFPHRKVIDNIAYGLEVQGVPKAKRIERATDVLNLVGLAGWGEHYPQQLSGGMQQRVGLGRALAVEPEILLFDEPFSALDPLIRREMQDELCNLQNNMHRTIIFITHDFSEALRLGDRIAIMKDGSFDQVGTPEEIVTNPATEYVREFTKDIPRAKVLTVRSVALVGQEHIGGRSVRAASLVERVIPMLLERDEPINVVDDDGAVIGIVNRSSVAKLLEDEQR